MMRPTYDQILIQDNEGKLQRSIYVRRELDIDSVQHQIQKLTNYLDRLPDERAPKQVLKYKPTER
jgi:hypothetical protein